MHGLHMRRHKSKNERTRDFTRSIDSQRGASVSVECSSHLFKFVLQRGKLICYSYSNIPCFRVADTLLRQCLFPLSFFMHREYQMQIAWPKSLGYLESELL